MSGQAAAADRWNDPHMREALKQAGAELRAELEWRTGKSIEQLAAENPKSAKDSVSHYTKLMTYDFKPVYRVGDPMNVPVAALALLETRFPKLSYDQRAEVIRQTALPSGFPLDQSGDEGSWQRVNLAAAFAADVSVDSSGNVTVK